MHERPAGPAQYMNMLNAPHVPAVVADVAEYVRVVFGFDIPGLRLRARRNHGLLPYFLADSLALWEMDLFGNTVALIVECGTVHVPASAIRQRLDAISRACNVPIQIYVTTSMTAERRRRLIEQKVAFIVPGKQLYLPPLGIDLRERFGPRSTARLTPPKQDNVTLTPSAQAILIAMIMSAKSHSDWSAKELASHAQISLSTTRMAIGELVAMKAVKLIGPVERSLRWRLAENPRKIWDQTLPLMQSPVSRIAWLPERAVSTLAKRFAGLDALSRRSSLSPPQHTIYAFGRGEWSLIDHSEESLGPEDGMVECQRWTYTPLIDQSSDCVDPLSLTLSFRHEYDDRVQISLEELTEALYL